MATAKRFRRAEVELVVEAAMIRAKPAMATNIVAAMVAKARRQRPRTLPIDRDERLGKRTGHSAHLRHCRPCGQPGKREAKGRCGADPQGQSPQCDQSHEHPKNPPQLDIAPAPDLPHAKHGDRREQRRKIRAEMWADRSRPPQNGNPGSPTYYIAALAVTCGERIAPRPIRDSSVSVVLLFTA